MKQRSTPLPTRKRLRQLFDYHPEGYLVWRMAHGMGNRFPAGTRFAEGTTAKTTYRAAMVDGEKLHEHRLIFAWHHGYYPENVDHDDRNKKNNRIGNLKDSDHLRNCDNRGAPANSRTGIRGVYPKSGKYAAYKQVNGGPRSWLGTFNTIEAAARARATADVLAK